MCVVMGPGWMHHGPVANGEGISGDSRPRTSARPPDARAPDTPAEGSAPVPVPPRAEDQPPSVTRLAVVAGALVVVAVSLVWLTRSGDDGGFAGVPTGGVTVPTDS